MTLEIAVLAPMPRARVKTATAVNFENLKNCFITVLTMKPTKNSKRALGPLEIGISRANGLPANRSHLLATFRLFSANRKLSRNRLVGHQCTMTLIAHTTE